jgi:hypothetical protein
VRIASTTLRLSACVVLIALRACRLSEAFVVHVFYTKPRAKIHCFGYEKVVSFVSTG